MALPLMFIPAAISAAVGAGQAIWGGKPSDEERELLEYLGTRMREGLTRQEEQDIFSAYAPQINRAIGGKIDRLAHAFGRAGTGGSTQHFQGVLDIPTAEEVIAPEIIKADIGVRTGAMPAVMGLQRMLSGRRQESIQAGLSGIMGGLGQAGASLMPDDAMTMEDLLMMLYGGRMLPNMDIPQYQQFGQPTENVGFVA